MYLSLFEVIISRHQKRPGPKGPVCKDQTGPKGQYIMIILGLREGIKI